MNRDKLSELLKSRRESLGKTQTDIADEIGIKDFTSLSHWENGKRLQYHKLFIKMCHRYGLTIEDLMRTIA